MSYQNAAKLTTIVNANCGKIKNNSAKALRFIRSCSEDLGPVIVTQTPGQVDRILLDTSLDTLISIVAGDGGTHRVMTTAAKTDRHHALHLNGGGTYCLGARHVAKLSGVKFQPWQNSYSGMTAHLKKCLPLRIFDFPIFDVDLNHKTMQGGVFGGAVLARFLNEYHMRGSRPSFLRKALGMNSYGPLSAIELIADGAIHPDYAASFLKPVNAMIKVDGKELPVDKYNVLLASTTPFGLDLGLTIKPFKKLKSEDIGTRFEILVGELSIPWFAASVVPAATGLGWWMPKLKSYLAEEVEIHTDNRDLCTIDGDTYGQRNLTKLTFGQSKKVVETVYSNGYN